MKKIQNDRIVVITGATSGIGLACKNLYEKFGYKVISLARNRVEELQDFFSCDVSKAEEVKEVFSQIKKKYGQIDILLNNAGYGISGAVELIDDENVENLFKVNLIGCINCYKYALPLMNRGGKIINISSVCAFFPLPYRSLYCASKAALNMLSYSTKMECKPLGIQVTSVCPGDTKTNFTKNRVKIYTTNHRYKDRIENATKQLDSREDKRMLPDKVAKVIVNLSKKKRLKPYIIVGTKYKILNFFMRFLPLSWLIFFTERFFGGYKSCNKGGK